MGISRIGVATKLKLGIITSNLMVEPMEETPLFIHLGRRIAKALVRIIDFSEIFLHDLNDF